MQTKSIQLLTPKEDSGFLYFIMESHEGLCFYSTIDQEREDLRLVEVHYPTSQQELFHHMLKKLQSTISGLKVIQTQN